jgi:hypothetical protein
MATGYGYAAYNNWGFFVPFIGGLFMLFFHIFIPVVILDLEGPAATIHSLVIYTRIVLRRALKIDDENHKITFHGYEIPTSRLYPISFLTTLVVFCSFLSFWVSFLFDETFVCDPNLDCFVANTSSSPPKVEDFVRVHDCAQIEENATVTCFEFVFDTIGGFSYAVGFFGVSVAYIGVYSSILIWLMEKSLSPAIKKSATKCCFVFCWVLLLFVPITILIILAAVPLFRDPSLKTRENLFKFYAYWFCFGFGGPFFASYITKYLLEPIKSKMEEHDNVGVIRRIILERWWNEYFHGPNNRDGINRTH